MAGASISFLLFGAAVALLSNLVWRLAWRQAVLLAASFTFLLLCAEGSLVPLLAFVGLGYCGLKLIESGRLRSAAGPVIAMIFIFVWLKRYTFLPPPLFLRTSYTTLGLSYILFRVIHLLEDASSGTLLGPVGPVSYLTYTLNFTSLVAGPIQRYQEFDKFRREARRPSVVSVGLVLERIITGFFKANVMAPLCFAIHTRGNSQVITAANWQARGIQGAVAIAAYPFFLYCNFSGYIDIVIGIAQLIGIRLPENFDRPFSADSFIGFWSRWHITLSAWLKTYIYNPLLMASMRRFPADSLAAFWSVSSCFVTFFVVGAWHGQTPAFLFFGVLQGLGVSMNQLYEIVLAARLGKKRAKRLTSKGIYRTVSRGLTFTWFAFTLAWFWSDFHKLARLAEAMGWRGVVLALVLIFVVATVGLAVWEWARAAVLRIEWRGSVILQSRYTRTAWCTVLALIAITSVLLVEQPAPELVYKAF